MKERIYQLAQEILDKAKKLEVSSDKFLEMSEFQRTKHLQEQSYINGQLNAINKVMMIIRENNTSL